MTKAFNGLTQCEKNRVKELDYKIIYVFIGGIVLFGAIFTGIILFLCAVDFNLNILYKKLLMSVQANYNDLDDLVRTRLEAFHNSSKSKSIEKIKLTRKGRNHRHSLRYLFRIFILIALVVIMLTISVLYLYENIRNSLEFRITFMNWMTLRGLSIAKVSYFTMESMKSFYSEFFQNESRNFTFMRDPEVHLNITFDELDIIRKFGFTKYMQDSMPPEVFTLLFTKAEGADFLSIGVNFAFNYARWESYSIIAEKSNFNSTAMEVYLSQATILQDISREIARLSEDLLQAKVQVLMNWLIYSILSSLIIITLILIYFYIPYFNKEQKIAIMIDSLIKMIGTQKN